MTRNIRNPEKAFDFWDWTFLNECFIGTNIRVTDIDGCVERNGHFLYIETKGPTAPIPLGQKILITQRVKDPRSSFLVVWGEKNIPIRAQLYTNRLISEFDPADRSTITGIVRQWRRDAESARSPFQGMVMERLREDLFLCIPFGIGKREDVILAELEPDGYDNTLVLQMLQTFQREQIAECREANGIPWWRLMDFWKDGNVK